MSQSWAGGHTRRSYALARRCLADNRATNGGRCVAALPGCTGFAEQAHHVRGKAVTGDDPRFLAAICKACNAHIGDPQQHPAACCAWGFARPRPRRVSTW